MKVCYSPTHPLTDSRTHPLTLTDSRTHPLIRLPTHSKCECACSNKWLMSVCGCVWAFIAQQRRTPRAAEYVNETEPLDPCVAEITSSMNIFTPGTTEIGVGRWEARACTTLMLILILMFMLKHPRTHARAHTHGTRVHAVAYTCRVSWTGADIQQDARGQNYPAPEDHRVLLKI